MYHLNCHLNHDQYNLLCEALYHYSESLSDANMDEDVLILEQVEDILSDKMRRIEE
mgnify:FL=1